MDATTKRIRESRKALAEAAREKTVFRPPRRPKVTEAHGPPKLNGSKKTLYKKGSQVKPGHRPLPVDLIVHEDVAIPLSDGIVIYTDVILPAEFDNLWSTRSSESRVPALVAWSPYGKNTSTEELDDYPLRAGIPKSSLSGLEKFEGPDPAEWCQYGYAIVNPDPRGCYHSEGDIYIQGYQEALDGAELIEWLAGQPWCNGKVGLTGNSWLAIMQYKIASLQPRGLEAIAPWEGLSDLYRDSAMIGGISQPGFARMITYKFVGNGRLEDCPESARANPLINEYWQDKIAHCEDIQVPSYFVASYTSPIHPTGTFRAFNAVPSTTPKWLRTHNTQEWPDYYRYTHDLRRFMDRYLKNVSNDWESTPKVRLSVLDYGNPDGDIIDRPESAWPLERQRHTKYHLWNDGTLQLTRQPSSTAMEPLRYAANGGRVVFTHTFTQESETTGWGSVFSNVSCDGSNDMDLFVQIEKLDAKGYRKGTQVIRPPNIFASGLMRTAHDWNFGLKQMGLACDWGPDGRLRVSHATLRDEERSVVGHPEYLHEREVPLEEGEVRSVEIALKPMSMLWHPGDVMRLTIMGDPILPFPIGDDIAPETRNAGTHCIHTEGSYLLLPHI